MSLGDQEFVFSINREGRGRFCCFSAAWEILSHEIPGITLMVIGCHQPTLDRIDVVERDWSYEVELPPGINDEFWRIFEAKDAKSPSAALDRYRERRAMLDEVLSLFVLNCIR